MVVSKEEWNNLQYEQIHLMYVALSKRISALETNLSMFEGRLDRMGMVIKNGK